MKFIQILKNRKWGATVGFFVGALLHLYSEHLIFHILLIAWVVSLFVLIDWIIHRDIRLLKERSGRSKFFLLSFDIIIILFLLILSLTPSGMKVVLPAVTPARNVFTGECRDYPNRNLPWYYQSDSVCACLSYKERKERYGEEIDPRSLYAVKSCDELPKTKRLDIRW